MKTKSKMVILVVVIAAIIGATYFLKTKPSPSMEGEFSATTTGSMQIAKALHNMQRNEQYLSKAAALIKLHGKKAFPEIRVLNEKKNAGIFVLNPKDGVILVGPERIQYCKNESLRQRDINIKVVAKKVKNAVRPQQKGLLGYLYNEDADMFPEGYTARVVVGPSGTTYVVLTYNNSLIIEKLFVRQTINAACHIIKKKGINAAIKIFNDKNSIFRTQSSYIWIYRIPAHVHSPAEPHAYDNAIAVCNPEYPGIVGKKPLKDKSLVGDYKHHLSQVFRTAEEKGHGWVKYISRKPGAGTQEDYHKISYFRLVKSGGTKYIVGTGLYLSKIPSKSKKATPGVKASSTTGSSAPEASLRFA